MTQYIIGNLLTGRRLLTLPVLTGPWSDTINTPETIQVTVDMNDPDVQALGILSASTPAQSFLAVVENGSIAAAGPIWTRQRDLDKRVVTLGAGGMGSYFNHRLILPILALTQDITTWLVPDPANAGGTIPNPVLATALSSMSLGTIAKRLVQQAIAFTGGNVPIVFGADESGTATQTYNGTDFKTVSAAIQALTQLQNGPEVNFLPQFTSDGLGVQWLLQTGTTEQPMITSSTVNQWNMTVPEPAAYGVVIAEDATSMGSVAWETANSAAGTALVSRATNPTLTNAGYALMELFNSSHTDVVLQATLDAYAMADIVNAQRALETWSFKAKAYPQDQYGNPGGPQFGDYSVGDFISLLYRPYNSRTGLGDPSRPEGGTFVQRIVGMSGDEKGDEIGITCAPSLAA